MPLCPAGVPSDSTKVDCNSFADGCRRSPKGGGTIDCGGAAKVDSLQQMMFPLLCWGEILNFVLLVFVLAAAATLPLDGMHLK